MNPISPITTPLSVSDVKRYEETGILFPIPVLDPSEQTHYRSEVDELESLLGPEADRRLFGECHFNFKWAYDLCTNPKILDVVEQVIGRDILVHSSTLFSKPPGKRFISWHQDSPYWHLSEPRLVSAWIALGESTPENGCMRVQPGSHLKSLDHIEVHHEDNLLPTGNTVKDPIDEASVIDVILRPGEMSLHHAHLLHGSNANRSVSSRIGYAVRFVAPEVRQGRGHQEVILARGEDRFGNFDLLENPAMLSVRDGTPVHRKFTEKLNALELDSAGPGSKQ